MRGWIYIGCLLIAWLAANGDRPAWAADASQRVAGAPYVRPLADRLRELAELPAQLGADRYAALLRAINDRSSYTTLAPEEEHLFVNDMLNCLERDEGRVDELAVELVRLARDSKRHPVLREYAIQHLSVIYPRCTQRQRIEETLWWAVGADLGAGTGTALIALARIPPSARTLSSEALAQAAARLARDPARDRSLRAAAVRVCGTLRDTNALGLVRKVAADPTAGVMLRVSALNSLGRLGDRSDAALLQQVLRDGGVYRPAAQEGLRLLSDRLSETNQ